MKLLKKRLIFLGCIFMLLFLAAAVSSSVAPADKVAIHSADPFAAKAFSRSGRQIQTFRCDAF